MFQILRQIHGRGSASAKLSLEVVPAPKGGVQAFEVAAHVPKDAGDGWVEQPAEPIVFIPASCPVHRMIARLRHSAACGRKRGQTGGPAAGGSGEVFMKRTIMSAALVGLLIAVCANTAYAQTVWLGVKGGWNNATVHVERAEGLDFDHINSFHVGALMGVDVHPSLAIELEALYGRKGYGVSAVDIDGKTEAGFLQLPLLLRVKIPTRAGPVTPHLFAGPAVGFELHCQVSGTELGVTVDESCDDFDLERKKVDIGVLFGAGLGIAAGPGSVLLDVAYDLGLRNLNDDPIGDEKIQSRTFCLSVGYMIPIGGRR